MMSYRKWWRCWGCDEEKGVIELCDGGGEECLKCGRERGLEDVVFYKWLETDKEFKISERVRQAGFWV